MMKGKLGIGALPIVVPDQFRVPDPIPVISIDPSVAPHVVGLLKVPLLMIGKASTVTTVATELAEHPPLLAVTV